MSPAELVPLRPPVSSLELAADAWTLAQKIAQTDFVPAPLRGKPEAVLACILAGHEAGISPMQSLAKIHVIEGRPAMAAELMRALVLQHGHELYYEEVSTVRAVAVGARRGSNRPPTVVTWTMDDAKRGGLTEKPNWRRWPRAMLIARATAELCRMIFPDVLAGISYTVEELTDGDYLDAGPVTWGTDPTVAAVTDKPTAGKARAKARKAITRPREAVTSPPEPSNRGEVPELPEPPDAFPERKWAGDDEPPPVNQPRYSGTQLIAIRLETRGIKGQARYDYIADIVGHPIKSSKELSPDEIADVLHRLDDEDRER